MFQRLCHIVDRAGATDFPRPGIQTFQFRFLTLRLVIVKITHQLLYQVSHGDDAAHSAVFIDYHSKMIGVSFHFAEKFVCLHVFVNEIGCVDSVFHDKISGAVFQTEEVLCIEHAYDLIHTVAAHRVDGMAGFVNGLFPLCNGFVHPQDRYFFSVGADLAYREIVKGKYIFNDVIFRGINGSLFVTGIRHEQQVLFRYGFLVAVGVDAAQPQHAVCGLGEQPYQRCKQLCNDCDRTSHGEGKAFRIFHGDAFRDHLAEHNGKIGDDERYQNDGNGVQNRFTDADACFLQQPGQLFGETV